AKTHPHTAAIAAKLKTEQRAAAYRRRKSIVEAPTGWIKAGLGLPQFSMRGLASVQA
ncbi:transposase, partial [Pseudomonas aeruginosa]|uniref:transposase n=1 Tax=Pseudomonas aeruginosa TaxID=287 RepID=UPI002023365C